MKKMFLLITTIFIFISTSACNLLPFNNEITEPIITLGFEHTLLLTKDNVVYASGKNNHGQIGNNKTTEQLEPLNITANFNLATDDKIIFIDAGAIHSVALSKLGNLYAWGANTSGQIGNSTTTDVLEPLNITAFLDLSENETIKTVCASGLTTYVLSSTGNLYGWGYNGSYNLCDNTTTNRSTPFLINPNLGLMANETIKTISKGSGLNFFIITSNNRLIGFGSNNNFGLGLDHANEVTTATDLTNNFPNNTQFKSAFTGYGGACVITEDYKIYVFGSNNFGCLGANIDFEVHTPTIINLPLATNEYVIDIVVGYYNTMFLTSNNRLFMSGDNNYYQFGEGNNLVTKYSTPKEVYISEILGKEKIMKISCEMSNIYIMTDEYRIIHFGTLLGKLPKDITDEFK